MENAGKEDIPEDAERKGLGTPATRAAIIEKLVAAGFVERKGKSLIPTKAGIDVYKRQHDHSACSCGHEHEHELHHHEGGCGCKHSHEPHKR